MVNFMSDNCSGVHPAIMQTIVDGNEGLVSSYGSDALTQTLENCFNELFEKHVGVALLTSGTAANCLAVSLFTPPYGAILCHEEAHMLVDEYGAPGMFTGGAQMLALPGTHGKIEPHALQALLSRLASQLVKPTVLSLTQATECGTIYSLSELAELAGIAKQAGLKVHMDGARFANALATLGCTPAEMTWQLGINVLSFGGTKNGCMAAEAVIVFDDDIALKDELLLRRKKSGHTLSKMRFIAAQFIAYLDNGLWLENARHANAMAMRLAHGMTQITKLEPVHRVQANEVFVALPTTHAKLLLAAGHQFYEWNDGSTRLVTSFATSAHDIDIFLHAAQSAVA